MTNTVENKNIALVGGAGFIGHNLALALKEKGANVHVVDSLQVNNLGALYSSKNDLTHRNMYIKIIHERLELLYEAGIPLHVVDARDYHLLCTAITEIRPAATSVRSRRSARSSTGAATIIAWIPIQAASRTTPSWVR